MAEDSKKKLWEEEEEEEALAKAPSKPFLQTIVGKIIIGVGALVVIVLISILSAFIVYEILHGQKVVEEETIESEGGPVLIERQDKFYVGDMKLNLEEPGAYLAIEIYLGYDEGYKDLRYELTKRTDQIVDRIRFILESNKREDIDSVDKRNNYLKPKILKSINDILENGSINAVYFNKFTIQYAPID